MVISKTRTPLLIVALPTGYGGAIVCESNDRQLLFTLALRHAAPDVATAVAMMCRLMIRNLVAWQNVPTLIAGNTLSRRDIDQLTAEAHERHFVMFFQEGYSAPEVTDYLARAAEYGVKCE